MASGSTTIAPARAGSRIEENRNGRQVKLGSCAFTLVGPRPFIRNGLPKVDPAEDKMSPARVQGYAEVWVVLPNRLCNEFGTVCETIDIDAKMLQSPGEACDQYFIRPFSNCCSRKQRQRRSPLGIEVIGKPENGQNSSSLRPTTDLRSVVAAAVRSGVKYPAAFLASISTCASGGTRPAGIDTRSRFDDRIIFHVRH